MTFEVILYLIKILCHHNVSIHINCYQNQFINEYPRNKKAKISKSRSFLVRYRKAYILNKYNYLQKIPVNVKLIQGHDPAQSPEIPTF